MSDGFGVAGKVAIVTRGGAPDEGVCNGRAAVMLLPHWADTCRRRRRNPGRPFAYAEFLVSNQKIPRNQIVAALLPNVRLHEGGGAMRKIFVGGAIVAAALLTTGAADFAYARGGGMGGGGGMAMSGGGMTPGGFSHGNKTGWGGGSSPPGWSHGNKKGWGSGTMPPGLARH